MESKLDYRIEDKINAHTVGGFILFLIGLFGIVFPLLFSWIIIYLVGFVLIIAGLLFGFLYFTTLGESKALAVRFVVLLILGFISILSPEFGLKIFTLILILFFLFAAITNFMLAKSISSQKGEGMAIFVGVLSLAIDLFIILSWQETSQFIIGLFVGFIFFLDGIVFMVVGLKINRGTWIT